jgi:hypothetical protein
MIRRVVVTSFAFLLLLAVRASAEQPRQPDVDACNEEAAAAGPLPAASLDGKSDATHQGETSAKTQEDGSLVQQGTKGRDAPATPAERQAFAACLARHGYYKGYYH